MDYLQNALQNNQKSDDFFDFTAKPKRNIIKMPIGKTDRSFDLEIDDDVMTEILKDRQRDLLAEQNLQREKLKKIQEENEYNDFFGLNKAADRQKKREEDIFSLPKAEYDALFAPPKTTAPQRNYPNILQNNRQNTQQNSMPNYAVTREPNIWQTPQNNINNLKGDNQSFELLSSNDKTKNSGYQNPLLKQAQTSIVGGQKSDDTYKSEYIKDAPDDLFAYKNLKYNEGRGYSDQANTYQPKKQGKKKILVITAEGINSKKEDEKREPAWDVLRKQLESYGDFEVDMPQDLSFYDYGVLGADLAEVPIKGLNPQNDINTWGNVKEINNYINSKVGDGNISDYYDGVYIVGYSGGGESADAMATILSSNYNIDVDKIIKIGSPSFGKAGDEKLTKKTTDIILKDDYIYNDYNLYQKNLRKTIYMDGKINVEDIEDIKDLHKAYFATPEAMQATAEVIARELLEKYFKTGVDRYGQTNTIL